MFIRLKTIAGSEGLSQHATNGNNSPFMQNKYVLMCLHFFLYSVM